MGTISVVSNFFYDVTK